MNWIYRKAINTYKSTDVVIRPPFQDTAVSFEQSGLEFLYCGTRSIRISTVLLSLHDIVSAHFFEFQNVHLCGCRPRMQHAI